MNKVVSRDGTAIAYDQVGEGAPVILVGGAFSYRTYPKWVDLARLLAGRFTVITYDRRGRGDSGDTAPYAVQREIEDLGALIDAAGESASVFGLSSGAFLALRAAASGVGIGKLALFEPPFILDESATRSRDCRPVRSVPVPPSLGRTGLAVSQIGLGLAALGRPGYINLGHAADLAGRTDEETMERNAHAVLDAAYAAGLRYVDAARSYGKAEAFLGSWLRHRGLGPDQVTVGSKWGYTYTAGWRVDAEMHEVKDLSASTLRRQLAESRELLGSHLRLYQIHSATLESGVLDDPAVLEELGRLRESGVSVGLTVTGPRQGETIERALEVGGFDAVQATWNVLERHAGSALAAAHAAGVGVIVKEALANGRLTARGGVPLLVETAVSLGVPPDALALAAVVAQPWTDVVLSGAATVEVLQSNLRALELELDEELLDRLGALHEDSVAYWETRAALPWT